MDGRNRRLGKIVCQGLRHIHIVIRGYFLSLITAALLLTISYSAFAAQNKRYPYGYSPLPSDYSEHDTSSNESLLDVPELSSSYSRQNSESSINSTGMPVFLRQISGGSPLFSPPFVFSPQRVPDNTFPSLEDFMKGLVPPLPFHDALIEEQPTSQHAPPEEELPDEALTGELNHFSFMSPIQLEGQDVDNPEQEQPHKSNSSSSSSSEFSNSDSSSQPSPNSSHHEQSSSIEPLQNSPVQPESIKAPQPDKMEPLTVKFFLNRKGQWNRPIIETDTTSDSDDYIPPTQKPERQPVKKRKTRFPKKNSSTNLPMLLKIPRRLLTTEHRLHVAKPSASVRSYRKKASYQPVQPALFCIPIQPQAPSEHAGEPAIASDYDTEEEWRPYSPQYEEEGVEESGESVLGSDTEDEEDQQESEKRRLNSKGLPLHPFYRQGLTEKIKQMFEEGLTDAACAKRLDNNRYGLPPGIPGNPVKWRAQVFRDAITQLKLNDPRNLDMRRKTKRIQKETLVKRITTIIAPSKKRKRCIKNGILADGSRSDAKAAYFLSRCNLPVPEALIYSEECRKKNSPIKMERVKKLIDEASPAHVDKLWNAERIRLAIELYDIPDHRKGLQHRRKKLDLIDRANLIENTQEGEDPLLDYASRSDSALKVLLLDYLTNKEARQHTDFACAARRLKGKVWIPLAVRRELNIKDRSTDWTSRVIEKAVWVYKLESHIKQKFARKDSLTKQMRTGDLNDPERLGAIKAYLRISLEEMLQINANKIFTHIASRIGLLNVEFPSVINNGNFQGKTWRADWVRAALKYFNIKTPGNIMIQRRFLTEKMRRGGVNEPARIQAIKDYVESLTPTRSYSRIANNLQDLSRTRGSEFDDTPIYIPTLFGGPAAPDCTCRWLSHHVAQVVGDTSKGHNRPDLLDIIRDEDAEDSDRILALSQYIDHYKFKYSSRYPKPFAGKGEITDDLIEWQYNLYRSLKDLLNTLGVHVPRLFLQSQGITTELYRQRWTRHLLEMADKTLGELWHHPLEDIEPDDDENTETGGLAAQNPEPTPARSRQPQSVEDERTKRVRQFRIPKRRVRQEEVTPSRESRRDEVSRPASSLPGEPSGISHKRHKPSKHHRHGVYRPDVAASPSPAQTPAGSHQARNNPEARLSSYFEDISSDED